MGPMLKVKCCNGAATKRPGVEPQAVTAMSVTKQEIEVYWKRKQMIEADHLAAALKAAARLRARNLSEEEYKRFEECLEEGDDDHKEDVTTAENPNANNEIRVGIIDWWTKSTYAYLNQPATKCMDSPPRRGSSYSYIPQFYNRCDSATPPTTTFGIC